MKRRLSRRTLLTGMGLATPALIFGGTKLYPDWKPQKTLLNSGEWLSTRAHRLIGRNALAREYTSADISPNFRTNGSTKPKTAQWTSDAKTGFESWRLKIDGKVAKPREFSLSDLKSYPARTQITRHDCVEGWSAIAQWTGVPLAALLDTVVLTDDARYLVFWCADDFGSWQYYESIDLVDAFHPQTILAYGMNGSPLPHGHGAPIRLRVERQLGYKQAKFIMRIEAVSSFAPIGDGKGGLWEDIADYEWYAGI